MPTENLTFFVCILDFSCTKLVSLRGLGNERFLPLASYFDYNSPEVEEKVSPFFMRFPSQPKHYCSEQFRYYVSTIKVCHKIS